VKAAYDALFPGALDEDDLASWYRQLTDRLAVAEAAIEVARLQRAQVIAHMHSTFGLTYRAIAERLGDLDRSRVGQLAVKGRQHIIPLNPATAERAA
jgi:hypothetical protein